MTLTDPTYKFEPLLFCTKTKTRFTSPEIKAAYHSSSGVTAILFNRAAIQHIAKMGFYIEQGKACDLSIDRKTNALRIRFFENGKYKFSRHNATQTRLASVELSCIPNGTKFTPSVWELDLIIAPTGLPQ